REGDGHERGRRPRGRCGGQHLWRRGRTKRCQEVHEEIEVHEEVGHDLQVVPQEAAMRLVYLSALALLLVPQATVAPTNDLPNPFQGGQNIFMLPEGRTWGSTSAVDIDKDGRSIWVGERCGVNSCANPATGTMSPLDPVLKFDSTGKLVKSFGAGMIAFAHGIYVDKDGNIWVTDANDNRPRPARGARSGASAPSAPPAPAKLVGHQVIKFSPEGKVLM